MCLRDIEGRPDTAIKFMMAREGTLAENEPSAPHSLWFCTLAMGAISAVMCTTCIVRVSIGTLGTLCDSSGAGASRAGRSQNGGDSPGDGHRMPAACASPKSGRGIKANKSVWHGNNQLSVDGLLSSMPGAVIMIYSEATKHLSTEHWRAGDGRRKLRTLDCLGGCLAMISADSVLVAGVAVRFIGCGLSCAERHILRSTAAQVRCEHCP